MGWQAQVRKSGLREAGEAGGKKHADILVLPFLLSSLCFLVVLTR